MRNDIMPIRLVGYLDWRRIENGQARFAQASIKEWLPKSKTDNQLVLKRVKLKKQLALRLGLTLIIPKAMIKLEQEDGWLDEKNHLHIMRKFYAREFPVFYTNIVKTKMNRNFHNFLINLKTELKASKVSYVISDKDPDYVKIIAIVERHDFKFPSRFITRLVTNLKLK